MYIKNPLFGFQNKAMNEYIKQSQNNYINLMHLNHLQSKLISQKIFLEKFKELQTFNH